jgi:sigma-B regulation protein RsbU (phosphoserine phosphatase)
MEPYRIRCSEIWGGISSADYDLETSSLGLSLYSAPVGGAQGGDIYYVSVCGGDRLTRLVIADLQGHGDQVSAMSSRIYESLIKHLDDLDNCVVLGELNQSAIRLGLDAMTTAAVVSYYLGNGILTYTFAGHPPVLMRSTNSGWSRVPFPEISRYSNATLGVFPDAEFEQVHVELRSGDRVCLYTDGVTEAASPAGGSFGEARLRSVLAQSDLLPLSQAKSAILHDLTIFTGDEFASDDLTLLLAEVR